MSETTTDITMAMVILPNGDEIHVPFSKTYINPNTGLRELMDTYLSDYYNHVTGETLDEGIRHKVIPQDKPLLSFEIDTASVKELKTAAMKLADKLGHRKSWIQTTSKESLQTYLRTEKLPEAVPAIVAPLPVMHTEQAPSLDLGQMLAGALSPYLGHLTSKVDEGDVRRIVSGMLADHWQPREIVVVDQTKWTISDPSLEHKMYSRLMAYVQKRKNCYLVGPAGTGKTKTAENIALALGLKFFPQSVCQQTSKSDLIGFVDANGTYRRTGFRDIFEFGGIYLMDEFDQGNPNVCSILNAATANGYCSFPDGVIKRHADCIIICSGNTYGTGSDRVYVGTNQLNGATLDRFAFIEWDYDEELELALSPQVDWTRYVQKVRKAVRDLKLRHIVSMRASLEGGDMIKSGLLGRDEIESDYLWKGLSKEEISKVVAKVATY